MSVDWHSIGEPTTEELVQELRKVNELVPLLMDYPDRLAEPATLSDAVKRDSPFSNDPDDYSR